MPTVDYPIVGMSYGDAKNPIPGHNQQGSSCIADGRGQALWFTYKDGTMQCHATTAGARAIVIASDSVVYRSTIPCPTLRSKGAQCGATRAPDGGLYLNIMGSKESEPTTASSYWAIWKDGSALQDGSGPWFLYSTISENEPHVHTQWTNDEGNLANASEIVMNGSTWFVSGHVSEYYTQGLYVWSHVGMMSTNYGVSWTEVTRRGGNASYNVDAVTRQYGRYQGEWWWCSGGYGGEAIRVSTDLSTWAGRAVSGINQTGGVSLPLVAGGHGYAAIAGGVGIPNFGRLVRFDNGEVLVSPNFASLTRSADGAFGDWMVPSTQNLWGNSWPWYVDLGGEGKGPWAVTNSAGNIRALERLGNWVVGGASFN